MSTETINGVATLIGTVGFPIIACYYLYNLITITIAKLEEKLDKNTEALERIADRLDMYKMEEIKEEEI